LEYYKYLTADYVYIRKPPSKKTTKKGREPSINTVSGVKQIGISPNTAKHDVAALKGFYDRNGFPLGRIKLPISTVKKENVRIEWTPEQVKKAYEMANLKREKALLLVGFQGGLDVHTTVSLNLGDFDDSAFQKLLNNDIPEIPIIMNLERRKTGVNFHTCLGYDAVNAIRLYFQERKLRGENLTLKSLLFVKEHNLKHSGQRIGKRTVVNFMKQIAIDAGVVTLERLNLASFNIADFHSLRASFSKILSYHDMNPIYIEYMLGHELKYAGAYTKSHPKKVLEVYREFEKYLSISTGEGSVSNIETELKKEIETHKYQISGMQESMEALKDSVAKLSSVILRQLNGLEKIQAEPIPELEKLTPLLKQSSI
jgi:hypothetical protein